MGTMKNDTIHRVCLNIIGPTLNSAALFPVSKAGLQLEFTFLNGREQTRGAASR